MWKKVICFDIILMFSVLLLATTSLAVEEQDIDVVQGDKVSLKCRYDSTKYLERYIYLFPSCMQVYCMAYSRVKCVCTKLNNSLIRSIFLPTSLNKPICVELFKYLRVSSKENIWKVLHLAWVLQCLFLGLSLRKENTF